MLIPKVCSVNGELEPRFNQFEILLLFLLKPSAVVVMKIVQVILVDLGYLIPAVEEIESFVF